MIVKGQITPSYILLLNSGASWRWQELVLPCPAICDRIHRLRFPYLLDFVTDIVRQCPVTPMQPQDLGEEEV